MTKKQPEYLDYIPPRWRVKIIRDNKTLINKTFKEKDLAIETRNKVLKKYEDSIKPEPIMDFNY